MRGWRSLRRAACAAALVLGAAGAVRAEAPARVVSMNLCVDQLALALAAPGRLVSVSFLSHDPHLSASAEAARAIPANHGLAEEVFLLKPDLVLAGEYTSVAAVAMLRRLGVRVEVFPQAAALEDVPDLIRGVGAAMDRAAEAEALAARFTGDLAALDTAEDGPRAALFHPNSYTSGKGSLADAILRAAGLRNLGAELGLGSIERLPLELLLTEAPEMIVTSAQYDSPSLAEEILSHPALRPILSRSGRARSGPDWVCGAPAALDAVRKLTAAAG